MTRPNLIAAAAVGLTLMAGTIASANGEANCADRERVVEKLQESYGETRQSIGLGANNALVEVFASNETGTWTITVTMPGGKTCLVASGQAYEQLDETALLGDDV